MLSLFSPALSASPYLFSSQEVQVIKDVTDASIEEPISRPAWSKSIWANLLIVALVVCIIFGGAYGIHMYQMGHLHKRADTLERVVLLRTEEVQRINHAHDEVINALIITNDALLDTNTLLETANDRLSWTNSQLSHSNRMLEMRTAELNFALDENKEILGIAVHDLKNPLGGIIGLTDMLFEDLAMMPDFEHMPAIQENLGLIHQAAIQMLSNVEALLDRHDRGTQGPLQKEFVFLNDVILTTLKWNQQQAKNKCLKIYFVGQLDKITVHVDVSAMRRILDNLVSNAIKYSPLHGKIWVELVRQENEVWVSVRDQGPGLTDEDMTRVFGRQQRLSAKPTAGEHASGFGLYIVKQLVTQHGGEVGVESVLGEGAAFWFKIPAAEEPVQYKERLQVSG